MTSSLSAPVPDVPESGAFWFSIFREWTYTPGEGKDIAIYAVLLISVPSPPLCTVLLNPKHLKDSGELKSFMPVISLFTEVSSFIAKMPIPSLSFKICSDVVSSMCFFFFSPLFGSCGPNASCHFSGVLKCNKDTLVHKGRHICLIIIFMINPLTNLYL